MTSQSDMRDQDQMTKALRLVTLVICGVVFLSALAGAGLAVLLPLMVEGQRTALALFGFEVVVAVSGVIGVLVGLGRMRGAPGMALACIGGTILLGSALGWQGAGRSLAGVSLTPFLGLRMVAAVVLLGAAAATVLGRERRSWRPAAVGGLLGVPVVVSAAAFVHPAGRRMLETLFAESGAVLTGTAVVVVVVLAGLLAASVHLIVGAFDRAVGD
jgi:hypothetical protein